MRTDGTRLVQVFTGDGRGKTSAAAGQALRAAGHGFRVLFVQFLKAGERSGEQVLLESIPGIVVRAFGRGVFVSPETVTDEDRRLCEAGMILAENTTRDRDVDMLVLDEAGAALELGLIDEHRLGELVAAGDGWLDMVMTGRRFPDELLDRADTITEMLPRRHHFERGDTARKGIEW